MSCVYEPYGGSAHRNWVGPYPDGSRLTSLGREGPEEGTLGGLSLRKEAAERVHHPSPPVLQNLLSTLTGKVVVSLHVDDLLVNETWSSCLKWTAEYRWCFITPLVWAANLPGKGPRPSGGCLFGSTGHRRCPQLYSPGLASTAVSLGSSKVRANGRGFLLPSLDQFL